MTEEHENPTAEKSTSHASWSDVAVLALIVVALLVGLLIFRTT